MKKLVLVLISVCFCGSVNASPNYKPYRKVGTINVHFPKRDGLDPIKYEVLGNIGELPGGLVHITNARLKIENTVFPINVYSHQYANRYSGGAPRYAQLICNIFGFKMGVDYNIQESSQTLDVALIEISGSLTLIPGKAQPYIMDQLTCKKL